MRTGLLVLGLVLLLAAILAVSKYQQRALVNALPVRIACVDENEARTLAGPGAVAVLGTGSMAPYIPAALPGRDPLQTVVAYVVIVPGATVAEVKPGALCIYVPQWAGSNVMHQAATFADGGWIMTGLHNREYENRERMTGANFVGLVARTYVWPPR